MSTATTIERLEALVVHFNSDDTLAYDLSLSIGVAGYDAAHPCSFDELLQRADRATYKRKQSRRRGRARAPRNVTARAGSPAR